MYPKKKNPPLGDMVSYIVCQTSIPDDVKVNDNELWVTMERNQTEKENQLCLLVIVRKSYFCVQ